MKRLFLFLFLASRILATSWTEFYVQAGASNLNAGSTTGNSAAFTYTGGTFVQATNTFTAALENPQTDGVQAGDWASIYTTSGATVATFVARVSSVTATTIVVHATAIAGSKTTVSEVATEATCKIGGAWAGPSGSEDFPFGFAGGTLTNASGHKPRVNFKGDGDDTTADYTVAAQMSASVTGIIQWQGYTTTVGDGGRAVFDGGTSGAVTYYRLLAVTGPVNSFADMVFQNNGGTGAATGGDGVFVNTAETSFFRCAFRNMRRSGIRIDSRSHVVECEAYSNNTSNSASVGGFTFNGAGTHALRCISHDNTGAGFAGGGFSLVNCISDSNGSHGCVGTGQASETFLQCDFYNNNGDGIRAGTAASSMIFNAQNCNFVNNRGWGINFQGVTMVGTLYNNRFGAGTMDNDSGTFSTQDGLDQIGNSSYANDVTPWVDPADGDFRINLAAAKGTGRGIYTIGGVDVTLGYPDIGSAQHLESAGEPRTYKLRFPRLRR